MGTISPRLEELEQLGLQLLRTGQELLAEVARETGRSVATVSLAPPEPEKPQPQRPEEFHTVGRLGAITEAIAIAKAQELTREVGEFNPLQYAEKLGLKLAQTNQWLKRLMEQGLLEYYGGLFACQVITPLRDWIGRQNQPFSAVKVADATGMTPAEAEIELIQLAEQDIVARLENGNFEYLPPPNTAPRSRPRRMPPELEPPSRVDSLATGMPVRVAATKRATRRQRSVAGSGGIKGAKQRDARYNKMQEVKQQRAEAHKSKAQQQPDFKSRSGRRNRPAA